MKLMVHNQYKSFKLECFQCKIKFMVKVVGKLKLEHLLLMLGSKQIRLMVKCIKLIKLVKHMKLINHIKLVKLLRHIIMVKHFIQLMVTSIKLVIQQRKVNITF